MTHIKNLLKGTLFFVGLMLGVAKANTLIPNGAIIAVPEKKGHLPNHFRTLYKNPVIGGVPLRASGSAQPTPCQIQNIAYYIRTLLGEIDVPIFIIDLRLEPHGYFDNHLIKIHDQGIWQELDPYVCEFYEAQLFHTLNHQTTLTVYTGITKKERLRWAEKTVTLMQPFQRLQTEKDVCDKTGVYYVRFPVMDHDAPQVKIFNQFVAFIKTLPEKAWVHFHCSAGRGRTSTFLLLYHLLTLRPKGSLKNLMKKHVAMGSSNLMKITTNYKTAYTQNRLRFLKEVFAKQQGDKSL